MSKLKWKLLIKKLIFILHVLILLFISYLFDRLIQMLFFELLFNLIQDSFKYRFHSDTIINNPGKAVKVCKMITIFVEMLYLYISVSFHISIYSNLLIILLISFSNALFQFYILKTATFNSKLKDKNKLLEMCKEANLTKLATQRLIMKYIENKSIKEKADIEGVEEGTISMSLMRSRNKLK